MRRTREVTAAVLMPLVLSLLVWGPLWSWALLVGLACGAALWEFQDLVRASGWIAPRALSFVLFAAILVAAYLGSAPLLVASAGAVLISLPTAVLLAAPKEPVWLGSAAATSLATLYVAAGGAAIIALRGIGWEAVVFLLGIVWAGDSAAYYVGTKLGKRKLAPVVSPKKSWEGFWGQVVAGAVFGALLAVVLPRVPGTPAVAAPAGALLGAVMSVVAVVGDLVESTFKRSCAVKDSGALLPGHGGLLDRLDSLLYASPVLYGILVLLPELRPR
ncbi:MAG TPA: phosphatidate cytidylyltransferase [Thermoanaerobaculia bacterium]|nr:phosphatidate cytidylyltransferase [Thermoanaerobaculia bacterium]